MKNEEFFRMLDGVEDKYIEEASEILALQQEAREGVLVRAAPRSRTMRKTVIASVAAAAVVFGAVFLMRNVGKNGLMLEPSSSYDSAVQGGDGEESAPPSESTVFEESSVPIESDGEKVTSSESDVSDADDINVWHPPIEPVDIETVFDAVDPVDNRVRHIDLSDGEFYIGRDMGITEYDPTIESSDVSLGYLKDFFGTDALPFDERYKANLERRAFNAVYSCRVSEGAKAYTPVDGKVIAVSEHKFNNGAGNVVAIEFEDKVFFLVHLDEINVKVGETVTAGQAVGICGMSGMVYVGDGPTLSVITMVKVSDQE